MYFSEYIDDALNFIAQKSWQLSSEDFFKSLVAYLGRTFGLDYVLINKLRDEETAESVALFVQGEIAPNLSYSLRGTPCENVAGKEMCFYPRGIQALFPADSLLAEMDAESYIGIPLWDSSGHPIGLLAALNRSEIKNAETLTYVLKIVAARSGAELERQHYEKKLDEKGKHLELILNSAAEAIYGLDKEGNCTFCNKSCLELLGYNSEADLLGRNMHHLIHHTKSNGEPYLVEHCSIFESFQNGRKIHCSEEVFWRADGSSFAAEYWSHPIVQNGKIQGSVITFLDISDRKTMEDSLREREEQYRVLFETAPHGSAVADIETGILLACNAKFSEMIGRPTEELVGLHQSVLHSQATGTGEKTETFLKHIAEFEGKILPDQLVDKDGNLIDVEIQSTRMTLAGREVLHGFFYDVTARNKLMEEYRRATQLAALGTVAAGVAHEINNPNQGILNYATMIKKKPDQARRNVEISERIIRESERITKITRELLDFARDNRNEKELTDICPLVETAIDLIAKKIISQGIRITTNCPESLPEVSVYPQGIHQVVINLVDNAADALQSKEMPSAEKYIKVSCYVTKTSKGDQVCLEVADQGIGMPAEVAQKATETFFSTKPSRRGTGLGLSIVRDIVNRHEGMMEIDSVEDEYTKVRIYLPLPMAQS